MTWARPYALLLVCALVACSSSPNSVRSARPDDDSAPEASEDGGTAPLADAGEPAQVDAGPMPVMVDPPSYDEVFEQGLSRYVGTPVVKETSVTTSGDINVHHFANEGRGPLCMFGEEFFVESREGPSDTLMLFLQGGGVCLSEVCAATPSPLLSLQLFQVAGILGIGGLLDPRNEENPTKDFDVVNAPYCDGSLFSGDVDRLLSDGNADNGKEDMAFQRGLLNLTATLEVAHKYYPNPPRIVLVGSSGGAYGVLAGTVMTRFFYPDTPLLVVSDSGAPTVNGTDTGFITRALTEFRALEMIPRSCPDCLSNGHATRVLEWALDVDRNLTVAYMTHARDHVIGEFFMGTTADEFEASVVAETERLIRRFPGRAFRFVIPSARHTLTMGVDSLPAGLQSTVLSLAGGIGVGFVGDDVTSEELATWSLGGMKETGRDDNGQDWVAYDWFRTLLNDPANTPNILQLQ